MAENEKEEIPMLSCIPPSRLSDGHDDLESQSRPTSRTRSASMSIPMYSTDYLYETETRHVSHTGPLRSERRTQTHHVSHSTGPLRSERRTQTHHVSHTGPLRSERRTQTPHVSHTGPLQSERGTPLIQMSCPIYISKNTDKPCPLVALKGRTSEILKSEEFPALPSISATDKKTWLDDNPAGKNEHLLRSGQLGRCNDPYCTTCPTYYYKPALTNKTSSSFESKFHNILSGDAEGWMRRSFSCLGSCVPGIMNPHAKFVQQWNKFFVISCLVSIFIDPLFFFLLSIEKEDKCIVLHWPMALTIAVVRSITDFIYLLHMLLQFRLAYISPESRVVGAGELVDHPKKIALHYLHGSFCIDVFVVLPLPQIVILYIFPTYFGSSPTNYEKNLLMATVLLQYFPRFYRFLPLLSGSSASGFIFETTSANFILNFFICALAGHVVGSCWYLFGLQRINQCLRKACAISNLKDCKRFIDCGGRDHMESELENWKKFPNSTDCLGTKGPFSYGIYQQAIELTTIPNIVTRYMYSFFWGFQQVSTLAGNQVPSYYLWEIVFSVCIGALGLFFLALLVGNMMNFLQALGRRRSEMQLRRHDVEQWMSHRRLPAELRRQVRQSERFYWAATRGVNEEVLLENMPEDLQRDIRRHLFTFIKKVRILALMEDPVLDAICERLRQKLYIKESKIFYYGGVVDKIIFIVRGNMMSVDADGNQAPLTEGDICGEELLTWCLDHSSVKDGRKTHASGHRFLSNRTVTCLTNVEAFSLRATDLEEVTSLFPRFLRRPRIQGAIRYESPYWRGLAATRIQVAWKYRKKCLSRAETSKSGSTSAAR